MTDGYLVTVMLALLATGGLLGSALTVLVYRRRELMAYREREQLGEHPNGSSDEAWGVLDQFANRFDSLETRLDFTERLLVDRGRSAESPTPA